MQPYNYSALLELFRSVVDVTSSAELGTQGNVVKTKELAYMKEASDKIGALELHHACQWQSPQASAGSRDLCATIKRASWDYKVEIFLLVSVMCIYFHKRYSRD